MPPSFNPPAIEVEEVPEYRELVERYNANAARIERLWARTRVEMRWRTERGKARREAGDGRLVFRRPLDTAMTVEVLGDTKLWAGSDGSGFWVFDLHEGDVAYYGQYGRPLAQPLPLPVQPEAVPYLLGLMPIDASRVPAGEAVELVDGYCLIEPPGLGLKMLLNPRTARPVRIDLTDAEGRSVAVCLLKGEITVTNPGGEDAVMAESAELYPIGEESRMTLTLSSATTDADKIQGRWFRFDTLNAALKPEGVVDLNRPAAE